MPDVITDPNRPFSDGSLTRRLSLMVAVPLAAQ